MSALAFAGLTAAVGRAAEVNLPELAGKIAAHEETFWKQCAKPAETVTSRDLFAYALVLAEANEHPERLSRLFTLAGRDAGSRCEEQRLRKFLVDDGATA